MSDTTHEKLEICFTECIPALEQGCLVYLNFRAPLLHQGSRLCVQLHPLVYSLQLTELLQFLEARLGNVWALTGSLFLMLATTPTLLCGIMTGSPVMLSNLPML